MNTRHRDHDALSLKPVGELWHVGPAAQAYTTDGRRLRLLSRWSMRRVRIRRAQRGASGIISSLRVMAISG